MAKSDKSKTDDTTKKATEDKATSKAKVEDSIEPEAQTDTDRAAPDGDLSPEAPQEDQAEETALSDADAQEADEPETEAQPTPEPAQEGTDPEIDPADSPSDETRPDIVDEEAAETVDTVDAVGQHPDPTPEPSEPAPAAPPQQTVVVRKGGFFPLLLGGIVSAAVGFAAARYPDQWPFGAGTQDTFRSDTKTALGALDSRLSEQGEQLSSLGDTVAAIDLAPLEQGLSDLDRRLSEVQGSVDTVQGDLDGLRTDLSEIDTRLTDLAKRPIADTVSREAIAAYEDELARLRGTIEAQRAEIEETIAAEKAEIQAIADAATQIEEKAEAAARLANARGALNEIQTALETGAPFAPALATLEANTDAQIGDGLRSVAADGVSTEGALRERFPDAARAALRAVREATPAGEAEGSRLANFLRDQLQTRSVTPREGDDPDAVLSRAEAAVRNGDLDAALKEIAALPDVAQAELADWQTDAAARSAAVADAAAVAQALDQE